VLEIYPVAYINYRGFTLTFHVYASNHGPGDIYDPAVTVSVSDPRNIISVGSVTHNWAGTYLPSSGTKYDLGQFIFLVTSSTPDGQYYIRAELSCIWSRATYLTEKVYLFAVQSSPDEIAARQAQERAKLRDMILLGAVSTIALVVTVAAVVLLARRRSARNHRNVSGLSGANIKNRDGIQRIAACSRSH